MYLRAWLFHSIVRVIGAFLVLGLGICILIALATYHHRAPSFLFTTTQASYYYPSYYIITLGASVIYFFGYAGSMLIPLCFLSASLILGRRLWSDEWDRVLAGICCMLVWATLNSALDYEAYTGVYPGGYCGFYLKRYIFSMLDYNLGMLLLSALLWISGILILRLWWVQPLFAVIPHTRCMSSMNIIYNRMPHLLRMGVLLKIKKFFMRLLHISPTAHDEFEELVRESIAEHYSQESSLIRIYEDPFWQECLVAEHRSKKSNAKAYVSQWAPPASSPAPGHNRHSPNLKQRLW